MLSFTQLRKHNYDYRRDELVDIANIDDWKFSPYSCFKARIFIELSTILAFFLQRTKVSPNQITYLYTLLGVIGGILLSLNEENLIITGCLIFYFKGALDWTDGIIARLKGQKSSIGHILDAWGSDVGHLFFVSGLTVYCYNLTNNILYLFILICFLLFKSLDFKEYLYKQSFYEINSNSQNIENEILNNNKIVKKKDGFIYIVIKSFMDERARTTDSVILVILLNLIYDLEMIIELIIFLYLIKSLVIFFGHIYFFTKKN